MQHAALVGKTKEYLLQQHKQHNPTTFPLGNNTSQRQGI
jgi:hypothetical protein